MLKKKQHYHYSFHEGKNQIIVCIPFEIIEENLLMHPLIWYNIQMPKFTHCQFKIKYSIVEIT